MKKFIIITLSLLLIQPCFAHSVFQKHEEEYTINKDIPFFINIIPNDNEIQGDIEDEQVSLNPQVHFFNKKLEENPFSESNESFFIAARRYKSVSSKKYQSDTVELNTIYKIGKWDLKGSLSQEAVSGVNQYYNYVSFEPEYKLNKNFSLFGGISHSITENFDQTKLGFKYIPTNFRRLEFELSLSNYTKQFGSYKQKLNFNTNFKL